jgi:aubergine-like protein
LAQVDEKCLEKRLPENIIIYRDGVGAGDIQTVLDVELKGIKVYLKKGKKISF